MYVKNQSVLIQIVTLLVTVNKNTKIVTAKLITMKPSVVFLKVNS